MVSLVLKRSFDGFKGVDTWFWKQKEIKKKEGGGGGGGGGGEIAVNLTGTTFICFSHFFYAFLCLCCLWTCVRSLGTIFVGSQSFRVKFVLRLFCSITDSLRKVLKNFDSLSQSVKLVGKTDRPIH